MGQIGTFLPFILMFVVMYLFMILPQQKKIKKETYFVSRGIFFSWFKLWENKERKNNTIKRAFIKADGTNKKYWYSPKIMEYQQKCM